jgi:hypothetical protein
VKLPRPGAPYLENLVATMLLHGNSPEHLDLAVLAQGKPFGADELLVEFKIQQNGKRKLPEEEAAFATVSIQQMEDEE